MYAFIIQNIHIVCNFLHIIRKHVAYKRVRRNTFYKLNYFMQKTLLITTSILMIFVISGCSQKTIKNNTDVSQTNNQNIFSELKSKTYTQNLSLEEAYKIIEPFVSKWASDAVLTKYLTSLPTSNNNYSSPYFEFDSPKNKKTNLYYCEKFFYYCHRSYPRYGQFFYFWCIRNGQFHGLIEARTDL